MRTTADLEVTRRWIKIFTAILAVLMLRVWVNVQAHRLEKRLREIRLESDRLTYDNGRLRMQIHQYIAPSHLESLAKGLGLGPVDPSKRIGLQ